MEVGAQQLPGQIIKRNAPRPPEPTDVEPQPP